MCWRCLHDCASSRATAGLQARAGWCARRCRRRTGRAFSRLATGQTIIRALVLTSGLFGLCAPVGVDVGVVVAQQRPRRPRVLRGEGNLCVREREGGRERGREGGREGGTREGGRGSQTQTQKDKRRHGHGHSSDRTPRPLAQAQRRHGHRTDIRRDGCRMCPSCARGTATVTATERACAVTDRKAQAQPRAQGRSRTQDGHPP